MFLSVIVTSYESHETLQQCLVSLSAQSGAGEIVVSDCSGRDPAIVLGPLFPDVRFLHSTVRESVPRLRWKALPYVSGELVAAVEARCVPSANWCQELIALHRAMPECFAWGGPVLIPPNATSFDWGLYFCEYGQFAPPLQSGPARALSGANLCYLHEALKEAGSLTGEGAWETLLHQRWRREGKQIALCQAAVTFFNSMSLSTAVQQRRHYGRGYAADRIPNAAAPVRAVYACAALALPLLLTWRVASRAFRSRLVTPFLRSLVWVLLLNTCWAIGELTGYVAGPDAEPQIF